MTSSPTPAVLADARARHTWDRFDRPRTCEVCGYVEHDGSGIGFRPCATPPASDAAVQAAEDNEPAAWAVRAERAAAEAYAQHMGDPDGNDDWRAAQDAAARAIEAAARKAASDAAVPAGFVLVPVLPTDEMLAAGGGMIPGDTADPTAAGIVWCFMLAAAPKVASDTGAGSCNVQWYPGAKRPEGAWHVVADGWRHVSSHQTEAEARAALATVANADIYRLRADIARLFEQDGNASCGACGAPLFDGDSMTTDEAETVALCAGHREPGRPIYAYRLRHTDATDGATGGGEVREAANDLLTRYRTQGGWFTNAPGICEAADRLAAALAPDNDAESKEKVCEYCGCKLAATIGGLEHHTSDCEVFPL